MSQFPGNIGSRLLSVPSDGLPPAGLAFCGSRNNQAEIEDLKVFSRHADAPDGVFVTPFASYSSSLLWMNRRNRKSIVSIVSRQIAGGCQPPPLCGLPAIFVGCS